MAARSRVLYSPGKYKVSRRIRRGAGRAYKPCIPQVGSAGRRRGQKTGQDVPGIYRGHNRSCSASDDVCKVDAYKVEKYRKQKDGSWQQVDTYGYTNNFPVGHGEKSIIQIMRFMYLTEEEALAIRWHMGAFDNAVKGGSYDMNYAFAQSRLAAMLHIADMMATHLDERTNAHE